MKKMMLILLLLPLAFAATAQNAALVVFTDMPNVKFQLYLNGEKQNNFHTNKMEVNDLSPGTYKVLVSFKQDGIADCLLKTDVNAGMKKTVTIEKKKPLKRKFQRIGRNIGNKLNKEEGENLRDPYYLEAISEQAIEENDK